MDEEQLKMDMKELFSKILADLTYCIVQEHKTMDEAVAWCKGSLIRQTGMTEKAAMNLIRMAIGMYLGEERYFEAAAQALLSEVLETGGMT